VAGLAGEWLYLGNSRELLAASGRRATPRADRARRARLAVPSFLSALLRRGHGDGHAGDPDDAAGPPVNHAKVVAEGVKGAGETAQAEQRPEHDLAEDADLREA
jgi:hypothetical protein